MPVKKHRLDNKLVHLINVEPLDPELARNGQAVMAFVEGGDAKIMALSIQYFPPYPHKPEWSWAEDTLNMWTKFDGDRFWGGNGVRREDIRILSELFDTGQINGCQQLTFREVRRMMFGPAWLAEEPEHCFDP